jgi:hypothetical protein
MSARILVEILLRDCQSLARGLLEASVHPPLRGRIWRASFRDETGRQRWRSTGTTDRKAALALAHEWEEEAQSKRGAGPRPPQKALIRVMGGRGQADMDLFTQREVALIMKISERAVRNIERRAIAKLYRNPILRKLWREWSRGEIEEGSAPRSDWNLTPAEVASIYDLAQTSAERRVIRKVMALIGSSLDDEHGSLA